MKTLTLCFTLIKRHWLSICITCVILAISLFLLITMYGQYRYIAYTLDVFTESDLQDAVFFIHSVQTHERKIDDANAKRVRDTVSQMDGVADVLTYQTSVLGWRDYALNVYYMPKSMRDNFKLKVIDGTWFSDTPAETEAVIGGSVWDGVSIGDRITLENGITAKVVGFIGESAVHPNFGHWTNSSFSSDYLFTEIDSIIFLTPETLDPTREPDQNLAGPRQFFVAFKEDATAAERENIMLYLEANGNVRNYTQIVSATENKLENIATEQFPLPIFLIAIATINMICICAVIIKRSFPDMAKYYLLGCTKARFAGVIAGSLSAVFSLPVILNMILAIWFPNFIRKAMNRGVDYILDFGCIFPVVLYVCCLIGILILMPMLFYRKYSPLDLYRRNL